MTFDITSRWRIDAQDWRGQVYAWLLWFFNRAPGVFLTRNFIKEFVVYVVILAIKRGALRKAILYWILKAGKFACLPVQSLYIGIRQNCLIC